MRRGLLSVLWMMIFFVAPVYADGPTATPNPYSLSGYVYNDLNLNGVRDDNEPGLSGISVSIDGPVSLTTGSSSDGYYLFLNLTNGAYSVQPDFSAAGYTASSSVPATVVMNTSGMMIDFGGRPAPATATPTATATSTPTNTPIPSPTATNTPIPVTNTPVPTATPTVTPTLASTATPASGGCSLSAGPERDSMGSAFTFVGAGFLKGGNVALGLVLPDGAVEGLPAQQANNAGSIGFSYTTQAGDQTGLYTMIAEGGSCRVSAAFYVDDLATPTPVKVVVQPGGGTTGKPATTPTVNQPAPTETPSPTPMPLLVSSDPLLRGVELMEADPSLATKAKTQPALAQTNVQTNTLPGGAGAGGWRVAITSNNTSTNQPNPETKKENNSMIWLLPLAGLAAGAVAITHKSLGKFLALLTVVLIVATTVPVVTQAQQGTPGKGTSRIEGFVINADTNAPPEGTLAIKIMVNGWLPIYSGKGGEWNITGLGAGDYEVELVDLPAGYNPAQAKQTVHLSGVDEIIKMDLKYYTGPAITNTVTMTSTTATTRVVTLGVTTTKIISNTAPVTPAKTISVTNTAPVTPAQNISRTTGITNALPAVTGGGAMFATPVRSRAVPLSVIGGLTVIGAALYLSRQFAGKKP